MHNKSEKIKKWRWAGPRCLLHLHSTSLLLCRLLLLFWWKLFLPTDSSDFYDKHTRVERVFGDKNLTGERDLSIFNRFIFASSSFRLNNPELYWIGKLLFNSERKYLKMRMQIDFGFVLCIAIPFAGKIEQSDLISGGLKWCHEKSSCFLLNWTRLQVLKIFRFCGRWFSGGF